MSLYDFTAVDSDGVEISGQVEAGSEMQLINRLHRNLRIYGRRSPSIPGQAWVFQTPVMNIPTRNLLSM